MRIQKISISISEPLYNFVDSYQELHQCKSRSDVVAQALLLLQKTQLERCYKEASKDAGDEFASTNLTNFGGVEDETW